MGGYFSRGASAGGEDEGLFNREDVTGFSGAGSAMGGPGGIAREDWKDDFQPDPRNPNIVSAIAGNDAPSDETAGTTTSAQYGEGTYPDIVEGSDSERTGTSWGLDGVENAPTVSTPRGELAEGDEPGEAHPDRNLGNRLSHDDLADVGSWSTIKDNSSPGSPTGNS